MHRFRGTARGGTEPGSARVGSARYTYRKKVQKARLGLGSRTVGSFGSQAKDEPNLTYKKAILATLDDSKSLFLLSTWAILVPKCVNENIIM